MSILPTIGNNAARLGSTDTTDRTCMASTATLKSVVRLFGYDKAYSFGCSKTWDVARHHMIMPVFLLCPLTNPDVCKPRKTCLSTYRRGISAEGNG